MTISQVPLGQLCTEVYRYPTYYDIEYLETGIPEIRGELIKDDGTINLDRENWRFISPKTSSRFPRTVLVAGDLVMSVRGTIGKIALVPNDLEGANMTANLLRISLDRSRVSARYLWRFMRSPKFRAALDNVSSSTTIKTIRAPDLKALPIPLPPLAEQRRIADVLDGAEALQARRRAALTQLDILAQSVFLDLFGDPAKNPKGWVHKKILELGKVLTGNTPPSAESNMFDGPIPFVTPGDLESEEPIKRSLTIPGAERSRTVRRGATLVCCIGATIGKMGMASELSAFNQQINAVEWSNEVDDVYGLAVFRFFKPTIKAWGASTTLPILKKSSFEKIEIPVPPLQLQREFARRVETIEKLKVSQRAALKNLDELFSTLQYRAFRGEL